MQIKNQLTKALIIIIMGVIFFFILREGKIRENNNVVVTPPPALPVVNTTPVKLGTVYITSADPWPPTVEKVSGAYTCTPSGAEITADGQIKEVSVNGRTYCVTLLSEGAAGSTYTTYTYKTMYTSNEVQTTTFTLRLVQCDNYDDPKKSECKAERQTFSVDRLADALIQHAVGK